MLKTKDLKRRMKELSTIIDEKRTVVFANGMPSSFAAFEDAAKEEVEEWSKLSRELRLKKEPKMEEIPDYGDHMTFENFKENVECGGFIDYDGSGNYATADKMSNISINPSDIDSGQYRKDFTHVVWFNK